MEKIFLAKIKNTDDRDAVYYMSFDGFECDHYFGGLHTFGACFSGCLSDLKELVINDFDSLETILTKEEFLKLFDLDKQLDDLGYGIKKDSKKYKQGLAIIKEYEDTIGKKLNSGENKLLFEKVEKDEKEYVKNEYGLTDEEVNIVFNTYTGDYSDRAIVCTIYKDFDEMVEEEMFNYDYINTPYFDKNAFGNDLLCDSSYLELPSGKIVYYAY